MGKLKFCTAGNCDRPVIAKGMCSAHYARRRNGSKNLTAAVRIHERNGTICKIPECAGKPIAGGYCPSHYHQIRRQNPEELRIERAYRFKREYGISLEDRMKMLEKANFKCEICALNLQHDEVKQSKHTCHIDHDHATGKVRGVLCPNCNRGLGMFKDSTEVLEAALNYLKSHTDINE